MLEMVGVFFFIWLAVLTYFLFRTRGHYLKLTSSTGKHKIDEILDRVLEDDKRLSSEMEKIKHEIKSIITKTQSHYQRLGLVRFNPFGRGGMDQSFVMAVLDEIKSGIVINFIYTPDGVRVYAKRVKNGQGIEHQLSEEERQAVEKSG